MADRERERERDADEGNEALDPEQLYLKEYCIGQSDHSPLSLSLSLSWSLGHVAC